MADTDLEETESIDLNSSLDDLEDSAVDLDSMESSDGLDPSDASMDLNAADDPFDGEADADAFAEDSMDEFNGEADISLDMEESALDASRMEGSLEPPVDAMPTASPPASLGGNVMSLKQIQGIKVNVQVILGSVSLSVSKLANLKKGELLTLDSAIGDPVDILANGHLLARGEIVVLDESNANFGITISEIVDAEIVA